MKNILITAIGSFSADIVIKTYKEMGYRVVGCDIFPAEWIVDSKNVDLFFKVPRASERCAFINSIMNICKKQHIDYLIPLTDVEVDLLAEHMEQFRTLGVCVCISDRECIKVCRNKNELYNKLKKSGLCKLISTERLVDAELHSREYPLIIKPYDGRSSQGLYRLNNCEEAERIKSEIDVAKYIIQPLVVGDIITVDVVRDVRHNRAVAVCRKELLRTLNGAGLSVEIFCDEVLEQTSVNIADYLGIKGCVNFEFIESKDGTRYFLECNPRFSGGVEFSCIAGYNCVENHLKCFQNEIIDAKPMIRELVIARKYEEHVMQEKHH